MLADDPIDYRKNPFDALIEIDDAAKYAFFMEFLLFRILDQAFEVFDPQRYFCLVMGFHDRYANNGIGIDDGLPRIQALYYFTLCTFDDGTGLFFQIQYGVALVSQFRVFSKFNDLFRIDAGCRGFGNIRFCACFFTDIINSLAHFIARDRTGETVGAGSYEVRVNQYFKARFNNIGNTADCIKCFADSFGNSFFTVIFCFDNRYSTHS